MEVILSYNAPLINMESKAVNKLFEREIKSIYNDKYENKLARALQSDKANIDMDTDSQLGCGRSKDSLWPAHSLRKHDC